MPDDFKLTRNVFCNDFPLCISWLLILLSCAVDAPNLFPCAWEYSRDNLCSHLHSSVVLLPVERMVIVTAWLVFTYLHRILRREQGNVNREQMLARLDMVVQGDISAVKKYTDTDLDTDNTESDGAVLYQELESVRAVI